MANASLKGGTGGFLDSGHRGQHLLGRERFEKQTHKEQICSQVIFIDLAMRLKFEVQKLHVLNIRPISRSTVSQSIMIKYLYFIRILLCSVMILLTVPLTT